MRALRSARRFAASAAGRRVLRSCDAPLALLLVAAAFTVDDLPAVAFAKLTDGGLWSGLALFVMLAIVLTLRPRRDDQSRDSAKVK